MTRQVKIEEAIRVAIDNNLLFYAYRKPGEDIEFGLQLTTLAERKSGEAEKQEAEVTDIKWCSFDEAIDTVTFDNLKELLRNAFKALEK